MGAWAAFHRDMERIARRNSAARRHHAGKANRAERLNSKRARKGGAS